MRPCTSAVRHATSSAVYRGSSPSFITTGRSAAEGAGRIHHTQNMAAYVRPQAVCEWRKYDLPCEVCVGPECWQGDSCRLQSLSSTNNLLSAYFRSANPKILPSRQTCELQPASAALTPAGVHAKVSTSRAVFKQKTVSESEGTVGLIFSSKATD